MLETLEQYSTLALYSAMFVYAMAFVFYVVDLANRSGDMREPAVTTRKHQGEWQLAQQGPEGLTTSASTTTLTRTEQKRASASNDSESGGKSKMLRIAFSLTVLGFVLHAFATVLRGVGAERVPFANMYEFALTATLAVVGIFIITQFFVDLRFLGALVTGLAVLFLGVTKVNFYVAIVPLPPALDSYWLVIHILVAVLSVGFFTLSFGLSVMQLLQTRRARMAAEGVEPTGFWRAIRSLPDQDRLEDLAYRMAIVGFVFWSFTLIAGSIWAERAWGRYWGWDVKEVWTFVIWVLYAGYIHARATAGWRGSRSAWLSIIAFAAVIFNFTIVNVFFKGLHAYSGL